MFSDYCLVYVAGISAVYLHSDGGGAHSIHPGAETELADPGPPELEGRRGRLPYLQDPLEGVDKPAYGATTFVVNAYYQDIHVVSCTLSVGSLTPQHGEGEPDHRSYDPTRM